jgi:hypothetical protein
MKTQPAHMRFFTLVLLGSLCVGASAQDNTPPQAYSAVALGTGGSVGGKTISFDFRIT